MRIEIGKFRHDGAFVVAKPQTCGSCANSATFVAGDPRCAAAQRAASLRLARSRRDGLLLGPIFNRLGRVTQNVRLVTGLDLARLIIDRDAFVGGPK